jgi:transcriptional regulator with XRE-family HTH domain
MQDPMQPGQEARMTDHLGQTLRDERKRAGWTMVAFARECRYAASYLRQIENGTRPVTESIAETYDRILKSGGLFKDVHHAEKSGDDVKRRAMLAMLGGAASLGVAAPHLAVELLREELLDAFGSEDWTELSEEYGHAFMTEAPDTLRRRLARDLLALRDTLRHGGSSSAQLASPRLMLIQGMLIANAGDTEDGARWYRAARLAADTTGDDRLKQWIRGREAFRRGYEGTDPKVVLRLAGNADDVEARLASAQAYARLDQRERSRRELDAAWRLYETGDQNEQSIYAMPAWRMALSAGYVHALQGDVTGSDRLLDQVAPPNTVARWQTQREMQRAVAHARARDTRSALDLQRAVIAEAPEEERSAVLSQMCRVVEICASSS